MSMEALIPRPKKFTPGKSAPFRVRIVDHQQTGLRHANKTGWAQQGNCEFGKTVLITLDDGVVLYGTECWWVPE